jgi:hypothetical protein
MANSPLWLHNGIKERTFKTEQALASHYRIHDELYCPLCSKYRGAPNYACNSHFM